MGDTRDEEESWERVLLFVRDFSAPQNWGKRRVAAKEYRTSSSNGTL